VLPEVLVPMLSKKPAAAKPVRRLRSA